MRVCHGLFSIFPGGWHIPPAAPSTMFPFHYRCLACGTAGRLEGGGLLRRARPPPPSRLRAWSPGRDSRPRKPAPGERRLARPRPVLRRAEPGRALRSGPACSLALGRPCSPGRRRTLGALLIQGISTDPRTFTLKLRASGLCAAAVLLRLLPVAGWRRRWRSSCCSCCCSCSKDGLLPSGLC